MDDFSGSRVILAATGALSWAAAMPGMRLPPGAKKGATTR
jgi:hypothetical protein